MIALAVSAFLSSSLIKFEQTLPNKIAALMPATFRFSMEKFFTVIKESVTSQSSSIADVKLALWELIRRVAIIFFVVFVANFAITFVTPTFPLMIRPHAEAAIAIFALIIIVLIAIRMKGVFVRLGMGVVAKMAGEQMHIGDIMASILYILTLGVVSAAMIVISYAQIERFFSFFISKEGAGPLIFILLAILFILLYKYILAAVKRLEGTLQITE